MIKVIIYKVSDPYTNDTVTTKLHEIESEDEKVIAEFLRSVASQFDPQKPVMRGSEKL